MDLLKTPIVISGHDITPFILSCIRLIFQNNLSSLSEKVYFKMD